MPKGPMDPKPTLRIANAAGVTTSTSLAHILAILVAFPESEIGQIGDTGEVVATLNLETATWEKK